MRNVHRGNRDTRTCNMDRATGLVASEELGDLGLPIRCKGAAPAPSAASCGAMLVGTATIAPRPNARASGDALMPDPLPSCTATAVCGTWSTPRLAGTGRANKLPAHSACTPTIRPCAPATRATTPSSTPTLWENCATSSSRSCARAKARADRALRALIGAARFRRLSPSTFVHSNPMLA